MAMGTDGNVDFVIFNYRNIPNASEWFFYDDDIGGIATMGTSATLDGKFIGTGVTALGLLNRLTRTQVIVLHEVCHYFFNHTSLGLMTPGHGASTYQLSPHEREGIGYIQPVNVSSGSGNQTFTLRDYIKYGDCLKIQIPNTSEYFYIANHQKKSKYDGLARGSNTCWVSSRAEQDPYCSKNKGMYIYHSSGGCGNNFGREVDIENAEGKWNWQIDYTVYEPLLQGPTPILSTITRNTQTGREEYGKQMISGQYSPVLINDDFCSSDTDNYVITWDDKGDEMDAYNIGYDEIFSPYSNPASNSCTSPTTNTGITFNLLSQDTSGAITLKIYFDNDSALLQLPPSKPKNVKVIKNFFGTPGDGTFHPRITWDANIEPDFQEDGDGVPPIYEIYRGSSADCTVEPTYTYLAEVSPDSTAYTDNSTTLTDPEAVTNPSEPCYGDWTTFSYKVLAKDNKGKRSLKSERGLVSGYEPCGGQEESLTLLNQNLLPSKFSISNYPNPFNPTTQILFELPLDNLVEIVIYDALGKEIKTLVNEFKVAGRYSVEFNGSNIPSGIYYCKIKAGSFEQIRKLVLLK